MKKKTLGILNLSVLSPTLEPWHGSERAHLNAPPGLRSPAREAQIPLVSPDGRPRGAPWGRPRPGAARYGRGCPQTCPEGPGQPPGPAPDAGPAPGPQTKGLGQPGGRGLGAAERCGKPARGGAAGPPSPPRPSPAPAPSPRRAFSCLAPRPAPLGARRGVGGQRRQG